MCKRFIPTKRNSPSPEKSGRTGGTRACAVCGGGGGRRSTETRFDLTLPDDRPKASRRPREITLRRLYGEIIINRVNREPQKDGDDGGS